MRVLAAVTSVAIIVAAATAAHAAPMSDPGMQSNRSIILVQDKKETTTAKVERKIKRAWKNLVGYKFNVQCLLQDTKVCKETGKSEADAQAKCQAQHPLCVVSSAK